MRTLAELLPEIERLGDREALRFNNGFRTWTLTYRDLHEKIAGFARHLDEQGIGKGDRVLIWGENRPEWVQVFWAALARGVETVPVDYRSSPALVERIRDEVGARLLVVGQDVEREALSGRDAPILTFEEVGAIRPAPSFTAAAIAPQDVLQIVYTSGTTGEPKGVVHRHRHIAANLTPFAREIDRYKKYARPFQPVRILDLLPLSHMFGQSLGLFIPVLLGGAAVFIRELHPGAIIDNVKRERVSVLVSVPRVLKSLRQQLERRYDLDSWQPSLKGLAGGALERWWHYRDVHAAFGWKFWAIAVGGAALPREEEEFWWKMGFVVVQGYGLTEASPVVAVNHPFRPRRGSLGKALEGQEVEIAPDGEILVRGESIVSEFLGGRSDEELDPEGWLHTGDIGRIDEEGRLYYLGRKKDVIVTSEGLNVHPQDVESVLDALPAVKESVVVGLPRDGEDLVHAALILRDPSADPDTVIQEANRKLESYQRIRGYTIWPGEDFPRTPSTMKVRRRDVLRTVQAKVTGKPLEAQPGTSLTGILSRLSGRPESEIRDASTLAEDLGLSSLDRIDLLSELEDAYTVDLDETALAAIETVGELRSQVEEREEPAPEGAPPRPAERRPARRQPAPSAAPRWSRSLPVRAFRRVVDRAITAPLWHHYEELRTEGLEHLDAIDPPVLFAANHESHLDTVAIRMGLPAAWRRRLAPAMAQEHFTHYFSRTGSYRDRVWEGFQYFLAVALFNAYPLPQRMTGAREALRYAGELIEEGYCPLVFPEGIRSPDGTLQPFKPGIGLMAVRLRIAVVPILLDGMFEIFSVHDSWPRTGSVSMRVGAPLRFEEDRSYEEVTEEIREAIQGLGRPPGA